MRPVGDAPAGRAEAGAFALVANVAEVLRFFLFSNVFKARSLIEGLAASLASNNFLVWTLTGRSVIEHAAVFAAYARKLDHLGVSAERPEISGIGQMHECLTEYTNGTRFDWEALLRGDYRALAERSGGTIQDKAMNVLTAIDHLARTAPVLSPCRTWYDLLSDFAHPNMASHSLYMGHTTLRTTEGVQVYDIACDASTPRERALFVLQLTLPPIAISLGVIERHVRSVCEVAALWEARTRGRATIADGVVHFDDQ
jgi:hypothetical protein